MIKKSLSETPHFVAGDATIIREVLHPKNDGLDIPYSLAFAELPVGATSLAHIIAERSELYIIQEGEGKAFVGDETATVKAGDVVLIPANVRQYIKNVGTTPLRFWCVVAPAWDVSAETVES
jgi:mannose-6-phosphate isomerase-like protein (cupin superfamily)